jgi:hypothetical protein
MKGLRIGVLSRPLLTRISPLIFYLLLDSTLHPHHRCMKRIRNATKGEKENTPQKTQSQMANQ